MTKYLTLQEVVFIHQKLIDEFGGSQGILDNAGLESAVMRPQSKYYQDIFEEAAALMESLAMNHPFIDGNKRVAFFATDIFLRMNGYYIECDNDKAYEFFDKLFNESQFKFQPLLEWIEKHIKKQK